MNGQLQFSKDDVELLVSVVSTNHSILGAAHGVKLIESVISYPINSIDDLRPVFRTFAGQGGTLHVGACDVTVEQALRYIPNEGFPIEGREQLISRLLVAFETERAEMLESLTRQPPQTPDTGERREM